MKGLRPRFEQVVGYLERSEPLPLNQPDRKTSRSSRLDDFVRTTLETPRPTR